MDGALLLLLANLYHGIVGFAIFVLASRVMPGEEFGTLSFVMAFMLAIEVLVTQGLPRAVSREVARRRDGAGAGEALRIGMRANVAFALLLTLLCMAAAPWMGPAIGLPALWWLLAVAALDMLVFAPYTVFVAALNGEHRFGAQAGLMASYSTVKLASLMVALLVEPTAFGGVCGYVVGSLMGSVLGAVLHGRAPAPSNGLVPQPASEEALDFRAMAAFATPMALFAFLAAAFVSVDFIAFKALAARGAFDLGRDAADPALAALREVGFYAGAIHIARMVYFVFLAFAEALFPSVARALAHEAEGAGARRVQKSLGNLLCLLLPAVALGMATSGAVPSLIFRPEFAHSAPYLFLLLPLAALLVLFHTLAAALAAAGKTWHVFALIALGVALNAAPYATSFAQNGPTTPPLIALAAAAAMLVATVGAMIVTFRLAWIPAREVAAAVLLAAAMWWLGGAIRDLGWWMFLPGGAGFAVCLGVGWWMGRLRGRIAPAPRLSP